MKKTLFRLKASFLSVRLAVRRPVLSGSEQRAAVKAELAGAQSGAVGQQGEVEVEGELKDVVQQDVVHGLTLVVHPAVDDDDEGGHGARRHQQQEEQRLAQHEAVHLSETRHRVTPRQRHFQLRDDVTRRGGVDDPVVIPHAQFPAVRPQPADEDDDDEDEEEQGGKDEEDEDVEHVEDLHGRLVLGDDGAHPVSPVAQRDVRPRLVGVDGETQHRQRQHRRLGRRGTVEPEHLSGSNPVPQHEVGAQHAAPDGQEGEEVRGEDVQLAQARSAEDVDAGVGQPGHEDGEEEGGGADIEADEEVGEELEAEEGAEQNHDAQPRPCHSQRDEHREDVHLHTRQTTRASNENRQDVQLHTRHTDITNDEHR